MGATKPNPRYIVLSTRVTDEELRQVEAFARLERTTLCDAARRLIEVGLRELGEL